MSTLHEVQNLSMILAALQEVFDFKSVSKYGVDKYKNFLSKHNRTSS